MIKDSRIVVENGERRCSTYSADARVASCHGVYRHLHKSARDQQHDYGQAGRLKMKHAQ